ncbi:MAG: hypothetical protein V4574_06465 [Pseudomonadota bacterium]
MAAYIRQKPPTWFWIVAVVLTLWGLMGCFALYLHITVGPRMDPKATEWDIAYYNALPFWFLGVYFVSIFGGLFGSIALLMRSKQAHPLFVASLAGVIVQFGYVFLATGLIAHKGAMATMPFPLFIAAVAVFQIWFSVYAKRRGWIA